MSEALDNLKVVEAAAVLVIDAALALLSAPKVAVVVADDADLAAIALDLQTHSAALQAKVQELTASAVVA
jgi:oligoribonuclease (3'-5' exoribonuclease)